MRQLLKQGLALFHGITACLSRLHASGLEALDAGKIAAAILTIMGDRKQLHVNFDMPWAKPVWLDG